MREGEGGIFDAKVIETLYLGRDVIRVENWSIEMGRKVHKTSTGTIFTHNFTLIYDTLN